MTAVTILAIGENDDTVRGTVFLAADVIEALAGENATSVERACYMRDTATQGESPAWRDERGLVSAGSVTACRGVDDKIFCHRSGQDDQRTGGIKTGIGTAGGKTAAH